MAGAAIAVAAAVGIGQAVGSPACALELPAAVHAGTAPQAVTAVQAGTVSGTATYYKNPPGNCSYPSAPADGLYVALSPSEYAGAAACGGYLEVHGPDGAVRVEVVDQCPECAAGHIDLSPAAFAAIAPLGAGQVSVSYTHLASPALPGPLGLRVKAGSSRYWLALLATNTGNPLASVAVRSAAGGWHDLARADYNYWIAASGAGDGPFTVRLTDTAGHQVTVGGIALSPGVVQGTGTYMYGAGGASAGGASAGDGPLATTRVTTRASASPSASRATAAAAATGSRDRGRPPASPRTSPVTAIPGRQPATPVLAATATQHC